MFKSVLYPVDEARLKTTVPICGFFVPICQAFSRVLMFNSNYNLNRQAQCKFSFDTVRPITCFSSAFLIFILFTPKGCSLVTDERMCSECLLADKHCKSRLGFVLKFSLNKLFHQHSLDEFISV